MEAERVIPTGTAAGEPQMGQVYDPTKAPSFAASSMQVVALDPTGAQMSNGEGCRQRYRSHRTATRHVRGSDPIAARGSVGVAAGHVR
jgi:hypothetical protein